MTKRLLGVRRCMTFRSIGQRQCCARSGRTLRSRRGTGTHGPALSEGASLHASALYQPQKKQKHECPYSKLSSAHGLPGHYTGCGGNSTVARIL